MTTARYTGMSRETGVTLVELEHIRQSVRDILTTPLGSRVMRRNYGSLLSRANRPAAERQVAPANHVGLLYGDPAVGAAHQPDCH